MYVLCLLLNEHTLGFRHLLTDVETAVLFGGHVHFCLHLRLKLEEPDPCVSQYLCFNLMSCIKIMIITTKAILFLSLLDINNKLSVFISTRRKYT